MDACTEKMNAAFEKYLDRDSPYGVYESTICELEADDQFSEYALNSSVLGMKGAFFAGFRANQEEVNRLRAILWANSIDPDGQALSNADQKEKV